MHVQIACNEESSMSRLCNLCRPILRHGMLMYLEGGEVTGNKQACIGRSITGSVWGMGTFTK